MKCELCKNTGFYKGKLCTCVTNPKLGTSPEVDCLLNLFGMKEKDKK